MVTDPIADLLVRVQNASRVGHTRVSLPTSRMKVAVAKVLAKEGYISEVEKSKKQHSLSLLLSSKDGKSVMSGFKRISKPSRRVYLGVQDIHPVKRGHGLFVLSTPAGFVIRQEAKEQKVAGEALFEIW